MPTFLGLSNPHYIYPKGEGSGGGEAPPEKWKVRGAEPPGIFLILRIKNKRFSLKDFHMSAKNSAIYMLGNVLVRLLGTTW